MLEIGIKWVEVKGRKIPEMSGREEAKKEVPADETWKKKSQTKSETMERNAENSGGVECGKGWIEVHTELEG